MDRLFLGGTQPRRSFLDRIVYAFDVEHAKRTANFEHIYKQWYQLLKNGCKDNSWLTSLEEEMACLGVAIAAARRELVARLNTFIENEPDDVFPNIMLELDGTIEKMLDKLPAVDVEDFYIASYAWIGGDTWKIVNVEAAYYNMCAKKNTVGIEQVEKDSVAFSIDNNIIHFLEQTEVRIYTINGKHVYTGKTDIIDFLTQGVYIIHTPHGSKKVYIRR